MTIKLMLDREALESLFPEGTEARVELRRAVTTDLVSRLCIKDIKLLSEDMQRAVANQARDLLSSEGFPVHDGRYSPPIPARTEQWVKQQTAACVGELIYGAATGAAKDRMEELKDSTEAYINSIANRQNLDAIRPVIREELKKLLSEGLKL